MSRDTASYHAAQPGPWTPGAALGPDGPLACAVPGFAPRTQQQEMAAAVADALDTMATLITEAGTGTGKTYAYLVPALLWGRRVIVSTGTKNLQDQLYYRDLPVVQGALGSGARTALLKGRGNYLCLYRCDRLGEAPAAMPPRQSVRLHEVLEWRVRTRTGDLTELATLEDDSPLWPQLTSTADNCLGQTCPRYGDCYIVKARRAAQEADVVVVNHHLLLADLALKEEGFGDVLPGADAFIIDEAHQLPEIAGQFFGTAVSSRQLLELAADSRTEAVRDAGDMAELRVAADALEKAARDTVIAMGVPRRMRWRDAAAVAPVGVAVGTLQDALAVLSARLENATVRGKGLENCWRRSLDLGERLGRLCEDDGEDAVRWVECSKGAFRLCLTPLDIAATFQQQRARYPAAWVFTSATLAVGDDFGHFARRLGIAEDAAARRWESPFDFERNAMLYLPPAMPEPADPAYTRAVVDQALPLIESGRGRAFLLFTSHRALQEAARMLEGRIPYPLLVQGTAPRGRLLESFREAGDAVLLGTHSFWEGVDVRGPCLSCVIIDKLPFASPDDPILQARIQALRERGENPFADFQLPHAVIALKQGIGRLIRDVHDTGLLALCDPRLLNKSYGRVFLRSVPPMPVTRSPEEAAAYLSRL